VVYNRVIHSGFLEGITVVKWFLPDASLLVLHIAKKHTRVRTERVKRYAGIFANMLCTPADLYS
jgi:hypothetical protein